MLSGLGRKPQQPSELAARVSPDPLSTWRRGWSNDRAMANAPSCGSCWGLLRAQPACLHCSWPWGPKYWLLIASSTLILRAHRPQFTSQLLCDAALCQANCMLDTTHPSLSLQLANLPRPSHALAYCSRPSRFDFAETVPPVLMYLDLRFTKSRWGRCIVTTAFTLIDRRATVIGYLV